MWSIDLARRSWMRDGSAGREARGARREERGATGARRKHRAGAVPGAGVLMEEVRGQQVVVRCCERAMGRGVAAGMTLAHARALLAPMAVMVAAYRPERDEAALRALAKWAMRFSPVVAADPPDGLLLDITGCERLFKGERRLVGKVLSAVEGLGFRARAAVGPTVGCAWGVARFGKWDVRLVGGGLCGFERGFRQQVDEGLTLPRPLPGREGDEDGARGGAGWGVPTGAGSPGVAGAGTARLAEGAGVVREVMAGLPVRALRIDGLVAEQLSAVGVDCVGDLLALPREQLVERFGEGLLLRMDQAMGLAFESVEPIRPMEPAEVMREFDGPVKQLEAIALATAELVETLARELERRESGARQVVFILERIDAEPVTLRLNLTRPNRDGKHLWRLLQPRVEKLNLGFGVERLTLRAAVTARLAHEQRRAEWAGHGTDDNSGGADEAVAEMVDLMVDRFGADRVRQMRVVETHVPERVFAADDALTVEAKEEARITPADRPTVLFEKPVAVKVSLMAPEGPVVALMWEGVSRHVLTTIGPERITPRWWLFACAGEAPPARDYYKLQDECGQWWWVYRCGATARWFVQGRW